MEEFGLVSVIPALFLIIYVFKTKRILEGIIAASFLGLFFVHKGGFFAAFIEALLKVGQKEETIWLWVVCGLMGSIIALIERAGGAQAFGAWVASKTKTEKGTLLATWFLGLVIFIDDYLNSLTVGSSMAPITDKHKVSREYLTYIVDSTAAPACVIIPITTWAVFAATLLETNGWAPEGEGMRYFIKTIPFNFYSWVALILVPLVILGVIPIFGPLKKAEERAKTTGVLAPEGSEKIDVKAGEFDFDHPSRPKSRNFFLPILVLIVATILMDTDMMAGVIITLLFTAALYLPQKLMDAEEFTRVSIFGIKNMVFPLLLMVAAFVFAEVNEQIGFTQYIISVARPFMTPQLFPLILFLVLTITEFITGTNWGMYIICFPIVIPLAMELGAHMPLSVAAVLSAGVFGSHICFYSDATILTSASCGCDNYRHAITQMPLGFLAAAIAAVMFLVAGFIF